MQQSMADEPDAMRAASDAIPGLYEDVATYSLIVTLAMVGYYCALLFRREKTMKDKMHAEVAHESGRVTEGTSSVDAMQRLKRSRNGQARMAWKQEAVAFARLFPLLVEKSVSGVSLCSGFILRSFGFMCYTLVAPVARAKCWQDTRRARPEYKETKSSKDVPLSNPIVEIKQDASIASASGGKNHQSGGHKAKTPQKDKKNKISQASAPVAKATVERAKAEEETAERARAEARAERAERAKAEASAERAKAEEAQKKLAAARVELEESQKRKTNKGKPSKKQMAQVPRSKAIKEVCLKKHGEACPAGHPLVPFTIPADDCSYSCNECSEELSVNTILHSCSECDYDLCAKCCHQEATLLPAQAAKEAKTVDEARLAAKAAELAEALAQKSRLEEEAESKRACRAAALAEAAQLEKAQAHADEARLAAKAAAKKAKLEEAEKAKLEEARAEEARLAAEAAAESTKQEDASSEAEQKQAQRWLDEGQAIQHRVMSEFQNQFKDSSALGDQLVAEPYGASDLPQPDQIQQLCEPSQFIFADAADCSAAGFCTDYVADYTFHEGYDADQTYMEELDQWGGVWTNQFHCVNEYDFSGAHADGLMDSVDFCESAWAHDSLHNFANQSSASNYSWPIADFPFETPLQCNNSAQSYGKFVAPALTSVCEDEAEEPPPEVIMVRENEYVGLQLIAEMGDWCAMKEQSEEQGGRPFFWNHTTGQRTWRMPQIMEDTGLGALLVKYAEKLQPPSHDLPDYERKQRAISLSSGMDANAHQERSLRMRAINAARRQARRLQDSSQEQGDWTGWTDGVQAPESASVPADIRRRRPRAPQKVDRRPPSPPPPPSLLSEEAFPALVKSC